MVQRWGSSTGASRGQGDAADGGRTRRRPSAERPSRHPVLTAVRGYFDAARVGYDEFVKPHKRLPVDVFVTKDTLPRALDVTNELFLALEDHGHQVTLAPRDRYYGRDAQPRLLTMWCWTAGWRSSKALTGSGRSRQRSLRRWHFARPRSSRVRQGSTRSADAGRMPTFPPRRPVTASASSAM